MNEYYGIKGQVNQVWAKGGKRYVATAIQIAPLTITQVKTQATDGYDAVQIAVTPTNKKPNQPLTGHLKKSKLEKRPLFVREIRLTQAPEMAVGDAVTAGQVIAAGDVVNVTGTSKGRGFAGVVKRWGFAGGPKTHGQSDRHRAPGSIGQGTTPGRVYRGKKMAGHMGVTTETTKYLQVLHLDETKGLLLVSGPVPGHTGSLIKLTKVREGKPVELLGYEVKTEEVQEEVDATETELAESKVEEKAEETVVEETETEAETKTEEVVEEAEKEAEADKK